MFFVNSITASNIYSSKNLNPFPLLNKGDFNYQSKYSINNCIKRLQHFKAQNTFDLQDQEMTLSFSIGLLQNFQLKLRYNGVNFYNFKYKITQLLSKAFSCSIQSKIFSTDRYYNTVNIVIPMDFCKKNKDIGHYYFIKNITINNENTYTLTNNLYLTVFHENFINLLFNKIYFGVELTAPIKLYIKITDKLHAEIQTNLMHWIKAKCIKSEFKSINKQIPINFNFIYQINKSLKINARTNFTPTFTNYNTPEGTIYGSELTLGSIGFEIGVSYTTEYFYNKI